MYRGTLVSGFANISVYFNKLANNFMKPLNRCFKRIKILLVILNYIRNFCNLIGLEQWYFSLI